MLATTSHRDSLSRIAALLVLLVAGRSGARAESGPAYLAADREASAVRLLDDAMQIVGSFPTAAPLPAGVARDGERVYTLHPESQEVIAYDFSGTERWRWSTATLAEAGGMAISGPHELGIRRPGTIEVRRPRTGALVRTITVDPSCGSHGLAWDGAAFWITCGETLRRLTSGPVLSGGPLSSPSQGCLEGGTALTASGLEELTIGCSSGAWFKVSTVDGSVVESSNNFVDDYGLAARFEGTPVAYVAGGYVETDPWLFLLDEELVVLAGFPSLARNAIAVDGKRIYAVDYFVPSIVTAYDFTGTPLSSWEVDSGVTGATMVGAELALTRLNARVDFHDPERGYLLHSLASPPSCSGAEALSFDGVLLWLLCNDFLVGIDPQSGIELEALPNPAPGCFVQGTALTNPAPQRLLVACASGEWFLVSSVDGSVVRSGNNGLGTYGINAVRERQSGDCRGIDLLVSQGRANGGAEDFYGGFQWPEMTATLDRAARTVAVASDLEDLQHMLLFDALWVDQRGRDADGTAFLTSTEEENLSAFLATGRKVVLVGGDDEWSSWNEQILDLVGGAYAGETNASPVPLAVSHPLVEGVTSLSLPTVGAATGGTALFEPAFAALWRGSALSLLAAIGAGAEYWPGGDNAVFFDNVARWIGCAASDLLFYDGFESADASAWAAVLP